MTDTIDKAGDLLRQRLREVEEEHAQLTKALDALGGSSRRGSRASSGAGRTSRSRRRSSGRRQIAPAGQRRQELIDYLTKNPGARPVEIARALNVTAANVQNVLRKALSDGVIEKKGRVYSVKAGAGS
jgi:predicted transcriptional regulator